MKTKYTLWIQIMNVKIAVQCYAECRLDDTQGDVTQNRVNVPLMAHGGYGLFFDTVQYQTS